MVDLCPNRIAEARIAAGMTQQQLANAMGVHWVTVSKLENGKIRLTLERMSQIAPLLKVKPSDLMPSHGPEEANVRGNSLYDRLKQAREAVGFPSASAAARNFGWNENTYRSHENGERGLGVVEIAAYARAFNASAAWIAFGDEGGKSLEPSVRLGPAHTEAVQMIVGLENASNIDRARARDAIIALAERLKIEAAQGLI